jgi:ABC-2 type transport system permease protein
MEADMTAALAKRFKLVWGYAGLAAAYTRLNFNAQLEYRGAFLSQVAAMFINDGMWLAFWSLFFTRFQVLRGWNVNDVITLWAVTASGFGLAYGVFGNTLSLARLIAQGQLDVWMLYPRALLPHLLLGKMSATAWGDALFGYVVYVIFVRPDPLHFLMFAGLSVSTAIVFVGFGVVAGSLSFYLGNATTLARQWFNAMITFTTYPAILFEGLVKLLLFTLIPAAIVSYLPVEALRQLSPGHALLALLGAFALLAISAGVFYHGLRRYESGNLTEMRG